MELSRHLASGDTSLLFLPVSLLSSLSCVSHDSHIFRTYAFSTPITGFLCDKLGSKKSYMLGTLGSATVNLGTGTGNFSLCFFPKSELFIRVDFLLPRQAGFLYISSRHCSSFHKF